MENKTEAAVRQARAWLRERPLYLDTETTGLGDNDEVIDLALIDHDGTVLIDTLIRPLIPVTPGAEAIHGLGNEAVAGAATLSEVLPKLTKLTKGRLVLIYNADFDLRLLHQSANARQVKLPPINAACVMKVYARYHGDWNRHHGNYKWQSQAKAARQLGLDVPADLHRAAADAQLCRRIVEEMAANRNALGQKITECTTCGGETAMLGTKLCDRCWELESRIKDSPEIARRILVDILAG